MVEGYKPREVQPKRSNPMRGFPQLSRDGLGSSPMHEGVP
jgi:hypothetical protein